MWQRLVVRNSALLRTRAAGQELAVSWEYISGRDELQFPEEHMALHGVRICCCLSASTSSLRLSLPGSPQQCSESCRKKSLTLCPIPLPLPLPHLSLDLAPPQLLKDFPKQYPLLVWHFQPCLLLLPRCLPANEGAGRAIVLGSDIAQLLPSSDTRAVPLVL